GLGYDEQDRALIPCRMVDADRCRFLHTWRADRGVLQFDRTDPFASRFDHVLCSVGDLHDALGMNDSDITGVEPPIGIGGISLTLEIALDDPRPANLKPPAGLPVARQDMVL